MNDLLPERTTETVEAEVVTIGDDIRVRYDRSDRFVEHRLALSPEAADAIKEQAKYQYAVPAIETTKQEQERTAQSKETTLQTKERTKQHWGTCIVVIGAFVVCAFQPTIAPYAAGIVTVLATADYAVSRLSKRRKEAPSNKEGPDTGA